MSHLPAQFSGLRRHGCALVYARSKVVLPWRLAHGSEAYWSPLLGRDLMASQEALVTDIAERARVRLCRKRIDDFLLASDFSSLGSLSAGTNSLERVFMPWPF